MAPSVTLATTGSAWRPSLHRTKHPSARFVTALLTALFLPAPTIILAAPVADMPQPGDYIVDVEDSDCPIGGPIVRVTPSGEASIIAQGGILRKPRGSAVQDDTTLIVADGQAGLVKVDLPTGKVSRIAFGPPWQPRGVVIDSQGNYIVVDWPENSAAALQEANGQRPSTPPTGQPGGGPRPSSSSSSGQQSAPPAGPPAVYRITPGGQVTVVVQGTPLKQPHGVALDADGNVIVSEGGGPRTGAGIIRVTPDGRMTVVRAEGPGFLNGADVRVDADGTYIVADNSQPALLRMTPDGEVTAIHRGPPFSPSQPPNPPGVLGVTGKGGPRGVVIDNEGNYILVDESAGAIMLVTPDGDVSTVFQGAVLCHPAALTIYKPLPPRPKPAPGAAPDDSAPSDAPADFADDGL